MQTAAGVAAGALAFEGVESIIHGFSHPGFGMGGPVGEFGMGPGFGGGFERPVEETVVNNYYDRPGDSHENRQFDSNSQDFDRRDGGDGARFSDEPAHHELHDSNDQGQAQFNDASYNPQGNDAQRDESSYNSPDPYLTQDPQAGFDQDNSDQGNYDQGDLAQNDPGSFDSGQDSGSFDDGGGGGFDSGSSDFS
jgi:uncharacterized protein